MTDAAVLPRACRALLLALPLLAACEGAAKRPPAPARADDGVPVVTGDQITLPAAQVSRFPVHAVALEDFAVNITVPARTVASLRAATALPEPLVLFENAEVAALFSEYTRAKATFSRTGTQLQRLKELLQRNAVAGKDVVDAETDYRQAEASVREAEGKLRQTGFDPRLLARLRIGNVLAVADVPEAKVRSVSPGESALLEFAAYPGELMKGTVATVGETVDPATRTVRVAMELPDPKGRIKPGMFARVSITERTEKSLVMPLSAVVSADARSYAFVKTGPSSFERREVVLDLDDGKLVKVRSGVVAGDSVAVANAILLKGLSFGY